MSEHPRLSNNRSLSHFQIGTIILAIFQQAAYPKKKGGSRSHRPFNLCKRSLEEYPRSSLDVAGAVGEVAVRRVHVTEPARRRARLVRQRASSIRSRGGGPVVRRRHQAGNVLEV